MRQNGRKVCVQTTVPWYRRILTREAGNVIMSVEAMNIRTTEQNNGTVWWQGHV